MIDSPIFPDELEVLPAVLEQAGFPVSGLLATHGDWDHVLGRLAFPGAALGVAETTAAYLTGEPGRRPARAARVGRGELRRAPAPLSLGQVQALPVPGHVGLGEHELELHPADGHTADGMAVWAPWERVLVCGDYLSPVEIPALSPTGLARRLPGDAGAPAPAGRRRPSGWCPATAPPIDGARAAGHPRRGRALPDRLGAAAHAADRGAARGRRREPPAGRRSSLKPTSPRYAAAATSREHHHPRQRVGVDLRSRSR